MESSPNRFTTHTHNKSKQQQQQQQQQASNIQCLYDLEETIGQGHFAVVKLARHIFTGEKVAIKVIDKTRLDTISREHLFQEVRCMKLVQHPNVVKLYEVIDTDKKLYLILELGDGGDMYDYIMRHSNGLSESKAKDYFIQIVRAIKYCHDLHVVHRDLKPENVVFFESTGEVKLTDFGFSNVFVPGKKLNTSCGSLAYSAPEILLGDSYDAPAVDVWSLGVILFMLVTGRAPFQEANDSETLTMILDCKYYLPPNLSCECQDLIARMLVREPEKRISLDNIIRHEWLQLNASDQTDSNTNNAYMIPLIKRKSLSEAENHQVIESMVNGKIASRQEIKMALDEDEYNYVTATYYLLSERLLRSKNQATCSHRPATSRSNKNLKQSLKQNNSHVLTKNGDSLLDASNGTHKRKISNSNAVSLQIESIIDEDQEISHSPLNTSPSRQHENNNDEFTFNQNDTQQALITNQLGPNSRRISRDIIHASTIPEEECELEVENVCSSLDKKLSNGAKPNNLKTTNLQNSQHMLNQIYEEGEESILENAIQKHQLSMTKTMSKKSYTRSSVSEGGETSTDMSDCELTTVATHQQHNSLQQQQQQKRIKKSSRNQKKNSRISSISDVSGGEETSNLLKSMTTIRTRSAESSNDLLTILNPPLKSLSNEHRLANQSQMSISSQLSKSNSVRQRDRDTPIHVHSSTPTPRESVVFNRGDEKPFAKILQSQSRPSTSIKQSNSNLENTNSRLPSSSSTSTSKSSLSNYESTIKPQSFDVSQNGTLSRNKHNDSYSRAMSSSLLRKNSDKNANNVTFIKNDTLINNSSSTKMLNTLHSSSKNNNNNSNSNKSCINCCTIL